MSFDDIPEPAAAPARPPPPPPPDSNSNSNSNSSSGTSSPGNHKKPKVKTRKKKCSSVVAVEKPSLNKSGRENRGFDGHEMIDLAEYCQENIGYLQQQGRRLSSVSSRKK